MRTAYLLVSVGLLVACNGSTTSASSGNDSGSQDGGVDTGAQDGSIQDTGAMGTGEAAGPDGCTAFGFDASVYALDGGDAAAAAVIGTPCLPSQETHSIFDGFDPSDLSLDQVPSGAPTCLVYHFRGLVTCPYGQNAAGQPPACASPCTTITGQPVVGQVTPQCTDRPASKVVLWSCRCANAQGATNDGDAYCTCPSSTTCTQVVSSLGASEDDFSGAYCLPPGIIADGGAICSVSCDPTTMPCQ